MLTSSVGGKTYSIPIPPELLELAASGYIDESHLLRLLFQSMLSGTGSSLDSSLSPSATPQEKLRWAVGRKDVKLIDEVLAADPTVIDAQDAKTGKTALHEAASCPCLEHMEIFNLLVNKYKANTRIQDAAGFTAYERLVNPGGHRASVRESSAHYKQRSYFLEELNGQMASEATPPGLSSGPTISGLSSGSTSSGVTSLTSAHETKDPKPPEAPAVKKHYAMMDNTQSMVDFVKQHLEYDFIGFLVKTPNVYPILDGHFSPIIYVKSMHCFIQLDSVGRYYAIPQDEAKPFRSIYSPVVYQSSEAGCGEAAIRMMIEIFKDPEAFLIFVANHSRENPALLKQLTTKEKKQLARLGADYESLKQEKKEEYQVLSRRAHSQPQKKLFEMQGLRPIERVEVLTDFYPQLFPHTEMYSVTRSARVSGEFRRPSNALVLQRLMDEGQFRAMEDGIVRRPPEAKVMRAKTKELILENLEVDDKKFDFCGPSYPLRESRWAVQREMRYATLNRLFATKLKTDPRAQASLDPKESRFEHTQQHAYIADRIASFATETDPKFRRTQPRGPMGPRK